MDFGMSRLQVNRKFCEFAYKVWIDWFGIPLCRMWVKILLRPDSALWGTFIDDIIRFLESEMSRLIILRYNWTKCILAPILTAWLFEIWNSKMDSVWKYLEEMRQEPQILDMGRIHGKALEKYGFSHEIWSEGNYGAGKDTPRYSLLTLKWYLTKMIRLYFLRMKSTHTKMIPH